MNDQSARSLFMDYLYDEISEEQKTKLETYLKDNPELRKELDELSETRSILQQMPEVNPNKKLLVMEPREGSFGHWWQQAKHLLPPSFLGKSTLAAAAGLILFLFVGSVAQLHIDSSGDGIAISMGYNPTINQGLSKQEAEALISQIREENAAMLSEYAEAINQQNKEQLQKVVNYFQEQRINDLQLVDQTLDELQQNTNYRLRQTNQYLGQVLQTVSTRDQN
jgi:hypothetical protein